MTPPLSRVLLLACLGACLGTPSSTETVLSLSQLQSPDTSPNPAPGGEAFPALTGQRISDAWTARGADYVPRTRHLKEGEPLFMNRLFLETSPYLRQHAHNPVDWHPWGDEAFAKAKELGRPVLLSVGYATCHWCHGMEEESFEDLEIARYINEHYVAIKVDREERPDVDAIYMAAVQAMRGRGGWPMTVWLTPDRQPFHAATYLPARDGDRGRGVGFLSWLERMHGLWTQDPTSVEETAAGMVRKVQASLARRSAAGTLSVGLLDQARASSTRHYDPIEGGRSGAPKFPSSLPVRFLLREHRRTGAEAPLEMALHTLRRMAAGGIYDHVGGGFHRYATDARWLVPHFEKMLYDNATLAMAYTEAWQLTGAEDMERVARDILDYAAREMVSPEGLFWSATDADSPVPGTDEREEGWFFTWTPTELRRVLGTERARIAIAWFAATDRGHLDGRSILHTPRSSEVVAQQLGMTRAALQQALVGIRTDLREERSTRPPPLLDDKVLAGWNGLMISAFARAGLAMQDERYVEVALRAAAALLPRLRPEGRLMRSYRAGEARHGAVLEDLAGVEAALLDVWEATGDSAWLRAALELDAEVAAHFEDGAGGWYRTADDAEVLLARERPDRDGVRPSGPSLQIMNQLRLAALTSKDIYRARAKAGLEAYAAPIRSGAMPEALLGLDWHLGEAREVVIVVPERREQAAPFLRTLHTEGTWRRVLVVVPQAEVAALASAVPLVEGKLCLDDQPTAYVCEGGVCERPTTDLAAFARLVGPGASSR